MHLSKMNYSIRHILTLAFLVIGFSLIGCNSTAKSHVNLPSRAKTDVFTNLRKSQGVAMQNATRGIDFATQGQFNEAKVEFEKALKEDPFNDLAKTSIFVIADLNDKIIESKTAILWFKGKANFIKGLWDNAIADYSKIIQMNPDIAGFYNSRGMVYHRKGQYDEAIADFNSAIELSRNVAEFYNNRGATYNDEGRHDKAIADFTKAIELNPKLSRAYNNRAVAYYFKKEYDEAWEDVHKAQRLGYQVNPGFLKALREASGRQK